MRGLSVVHAHMSVHVEITRLAGVIAHPGLGQFLHPRLGIAGLGHQRCLRAQRARFGHAVQPDHLAQLARRNMPQVFGTPYPPKRHESQYKKDMQTTVEPLRKSKIFADAAEKPIGAQRGQPREQTAHHHVAAMLELRRRALRQPHRRRHAFIGPRAGRAQTQRRLSIRAAAFGLGASRIGGNTDGVLAGPADSAARERLTQRGIADAGLFGDGRGRQAAREQLFAPRNPAGRHDGGTRAMAGWTEKGIGAACSQLLKPMHQCAFGNAQGRLLQLAGTHMAIVHQRRQNEMLRRRILDTMMEEVVGSEEIGDDAILLE